MIKLISIMINYKIINKSNNNNCNKNKNNKILIII